MFVRLALERDFDEIVEMGRINAELTKQRDVFSERRAREVCQAYLDTADPTIFVVEENRRLVGFMLAGVCSYDHRDGFFTTQRVLFVRPERRGSRAAVLLMRHLVEWSRQIGAAEVCGGNDNEFNSERTARFLEHFGFQRVGYALTLRLDETNGLRRQGIKG